MKHGNVETFEDFINFKFIEALSNTSKIIDEKIEEPKNTILNIWLYLAPMELFEHLYLPNEHGITYIPLLENAEYQNGEECAYLTQGFMIYNLERIITNSSEYKDQTGLSVEYIKNAIDLIGVFLNTGKDFLSFSRYLYRQINTPAEHSFLAPTTDS